MSWRTCGWRDVEGVAAAGVVDVAAGVAVVQAVVGLVVDAAEAQGRAGAAAFGGVVVDHVEDDLDACAVQRRDHLLELAHLAAALAAQGRGRVGGVRGEVADRVVAPVVAQAALQQVRLGGEVVDGEELDGGDAQVYQVVDHGGMGEGCIGAA